MQQIEITIEIKELITSACGAKHLVDASNHSISMIYGLFRASSRIPHFGTNQSTFQTKTLNPKYSTQILLSIGRMQMTIFLQEVKQALFWCKMLI